MVQPESVDSAGAGRETESSLRRGRSSVLPSPGLPGMGARVGVGGVGRDDVADPTEQAARADPEARRDYQPQDAGKKAPVVELPDSGDDRA